MAGSNDTDLKSAVGLLTLMMLRGIGPATAEKLANRYSTVEAILATNPETLRGQLSSRVVEPLTRTSFRAAKFAAIEVLEKALDLGVTVVSAFDDDYPLALRSIPDRPPILYVKGVLPTTRCVACIGTREPSLFGITVTQRLVEFLASCRWTIVSGLAVGVDTMSHETALKANGKTIAVLGCGLDKIYPKENAILAEKILRTDGALISEQPFSVPPTPRNLVQRDRIQSGLSVGTFVMQTDIKGGSMHTVRHSVLQRRLVFAPIPTGTHALEPKSQGIVALTKMSGREFAVAVQAEGEYHRALVSQFGVGPVAKGISSRADYEGVLQTLEQRLAGATSSVVKIAPVQDSMV